MHCQFSLYCYLTIVKPDTAVNKKHIPHRGILNPHINIFVNQLQIRNGTSTYIYTKYHFYLWLIKTEIHL